MDLFTLAVNLSMDASSFNQQAQSVLNTLNTLGSKLGTNTSSSSGTSLASRTIMIGNLASVAIQKVADAVVKLGKSGVKYNATVERYQSSFSALLGSEEKAVEMMDKLRTFAESTSFDLPGSAQIADRFLSAGFAAEEALDLMARLGDVAGSDMDKFSGLALVFEQMKGLGKMYMNDLRQMTSRSFNPLLTLAEETGLTMAEINQIVQENPVAHIEIPESVTEKIAAARKEVELLGDAASSQAKSLALFGDELDLDNYGIAFETVYRMLKVATDEGGQFYGRLEKEAQTVTGQAEHLKESFSALMGQLSKPISDVIGEKILPSTNELVDSLAEAHEQGGFRGLLSTLTTTGAQGLEDAANSAISGFNALFGTDVEEVPWLSEETMETLENLAAFFGDIATAAKEVVQQVTGFVQENEGFVKTLGAIALGLTALDHPIATAIAGFSLLVANWKDIKSWASDSLAAVRDFLDLHVPEGFMSAVSTVWAAIKSSAEGALEAAKQFLTLFDSEKQMEIQQKVQQAYEEGGVAGALGTAIDESWYAPLFEDDESLWTPPEDLKTIVVPPGFSTGEPQARVSVTQNFYSPEQSAADLMQEARWQYEQLRLGGAVE